MGIENGIPRGEKSRFHANNHTKNKIITSRMGGSLFS
jgi:hypothetical protein